MSFLSKNIGENSQTREFMRLLKRKKKEKEKREKISRFCLNQGVLVDLLVYQYSLYC